MAQSYSDTILAVVRSSAFLRATFSGPPRLQKSTSLRRAMVRPIDLHNAPHFLVARFDDKKDVTHNYPVSEVANALADVLAIGFANVHLTTTEEEIDVRLSKKHELFVGRKKKPATSPGTAVPGLEPHNRAKIVPLPEGRADRVLQLMGIMTLEGQIRPTMRAKYTQINQFLQLLDHVLPELAPFDRPLEILDCGSGSAYLTVATHHYLNDVRKIVATVLGVDINEELIRKSAQIVSTLECSGNLSFAAGRIGQLEDVHPDIVLALHACDTATDDALAQAIKSGARLVLAVPCCHKNLNKTLHAAVLEPMHHHGILHQRLADLATDALRAQILRIMGYRAEVMEFVSPEHTAKNLMIRAVKIPNRPAAKSRQEYEAMKSFFGVTPYLESALGERFDRG